MEIFNASFAPKDCYMSTPYINYGDDSDGASQATPIKKGKNKWPRRKTIRNSMETSSRATRLEKEAYIKYIDKINIFETLANSTVPKPSLIKDALKEGHSYKLLKIRTVKTLWGSKFVWKLRDADDEDVPSVRVYAVKALTRYVTKNNNQLDPTMVKCLKDCRIKYHGYLPYGEPKYQFTFSMYM